MTWKRYDEHFGNLVLWYPKLYRVDQRVNYFRMEFISRPLMRKVGSASQVPWLLVPDLSEAYGP